MNVFNNILIVPLKMSNDVEKSQERNFRTIFIWNWPKLKKPCKQEKSILELAESAGAAEYTDCISIEE